jgi:hypothetical protein
MRLIHGADRDQRPRQGEWVIIHRCTGCGELDSNRAAADDSPLLLLRLAVRPLALPPFPLDLLGQL